MSDLVLEVHSRETTGKNHNRRLRAEGKVPAVVYGIGKDPAVIQVDRRKVVELLRDMADESPVFLLQMAGTDQKRHCMIRELLTDPISGTVMHIDFQRVNMEEEIQVAVRVDLIGTPKGVKDDGGMLDFVTREVSILALPNAIPGHIDLDVTALEVGVHVEAGQLELPEGVRLADDEESRVIVSIHGKQVAEAVGEEDAEADEAAES